MGGANSMAEDGKESELEESVQASVSEGGTVLLLPDAVQRRLTAVFIIHRQDIFLWSLRRRWRLPSVKRRVST